MKALETHTHTRDDYSNPRCACAPRVNHKYTRVGSNLSFTPINIHDRKIGTPTLCTYITYIDTYMTRLEELLLLRVRVFVHLSRVWCDLLGPLHVPIVE